jgi:APA family basic amino acid/polyamine antiporter
MATSNLPAANAVAIVFGDKGAFILTLFGVLSVAAVTNLKMMGAARVAYALARGGTLPVIMTQVAASGTPRIALTVTTLLAAAFAATGTYTTIIATNTALTVFSIAAANLAAIGLRRREPDLLRPFKMPWYPLPALFALAINLLLLAAFVWEDPIYSFVGAVAVGRHRNLICHVAPVGPWTTGRICRKSHHQNRTLTVRCYPQLQARRLMDVTCAKRNAWILAFL